MIRTILTLQYLNEVYYAKTMNIALIKQYACFFKINTDLIDSGKLYNN